MPHARQRHAIVQTQKKLGFSRVITIQGCRQSGKSFLAREILAKALPDSLYVTFDKKSIRDFAKENPDTFLQQHKDHPTLMIDEAQKAPSIFDAVKAEVDTHPRPGQYILLGSTEFAREVQVRESLTGRVSRIRLYTMNAAECLEISPNPSKNLGLLNDKPRISRHQLLQHLERGGLPGVFAVRDTSAREALFTDWLEVTAYRDLHQFQKIRVDPDLTLSVLNLVTQLEEPTASAIAARLRKDTRVIQRLLKLLEILFVVHRLDPHPLGTGKPRYFLCDPGLAHRLGATFERKLETWFLHEQLSQRSYRGDSDHRLYYYRNTKGSLIHFLIENSRGTEPLLAIKLLPSERMDMREFEILKAFREKAKKNKLAVQLATFSSESFFLRKELIRGYAWETIA